MRLHGVFGIARPNVGWVCCLSFPLAILAAGLVSLLPAGVLAATIPVSYTGPNNGQWNTASNWSPAGVPANSGTNQFTVTIASNAVVFNLVGTTTINDLLLSNALQLNANCNLAVTNQLSLTEASLTANGGSFTANGPATTATNLSVTAAGGAQVALQALTQITENTYAYGSLQANQANSLLDLSQVATIAVNDIFTGVQASSGGEVNLHGLLSISTSGQTAGFTASGGTIDLSNLGVGSGTSNSGISVAVSNAGSVLWGSPTSLSNVSLTVTGTGNTINVSQVATATNVSLTAASGAQVSLPALTQITEYAYAYGSLQADQANSLLDLSHVTTIAVNDIFTGVQASSGGEVNLHNLLSITSTSGQTAGFTASGGTIDLSNLGVGSGTSNSGISVAVSNAGSVLWGSPTSLSNVSLTVTGTGNTINVSQVATATNVSLTAAGGAQVSLPAITQITEYAYAYGSLQANRRTACWTSPT